MMGDGWPLPGKMIGCLWIAQAAAYLRGYFVLLEPCFCGNCQEVGEVSTLFG